MGHVAKACRARKRVEGATNLALEDVTNEGLLLMAQDEENINNDTLWYLNSGASNHMCGHEYLFKEMQKIEDGHVSFGDASKVEVKGRGTIHFLQKDGVMGANPRCLLHTRPQDQHIEYGATHRERLLNILKGPPATPEG